MLAENSVVVLGLQTREACPGPTEQMDEFGHALTAGAVQEICPYVALPSRRDPALDQATALQRSRGRDEQQDQVDQPPFLWVSQCSVFHRGDLSLLCQIAAADGMLITLLGEEPDF